MNAATPTPSVFDTQSLAALKQGLRKDDPQALKAAAQQFEAVFLQMVMKSMRAATPQDGMFDSEQTRFYQELLDSQLAQVLASQGGTGLAAVIERQLSRQDAVTGPEGGAGLPLSPPQRSLPLDAPARQLSLPANGSPRALPIDSSPVRPANPTVAPPPVSSVPDPLPVTATPAANRDAQGFVAEAWPHAVAASQKTGIPPHFLVAHAALESGWGRAEPRFADGRPSHNLFGIKAGQNWQGATVETVTTEFEGGVASRRVERFRAYGSYEEAFQDYARLLAQSPRYAAVLGTQDAAGFARGLQRAGYATDPAYASKLERIISGPTLRQALIG